MALVVPDWLNAVCFLPLWFSVLPMSKFSPLVVAVAEHVPAHDMLRVHEALRTQDRTRLVGPNCPGIMSPRARCRVGIMPYGQYEAGCVGIVSKSGTLSYEAVGATTTAGLGQSVVVGMGGDMLPGTFTENLFPLFLWQVVHVGIGVEE